MNKENLYQKNLHRLTVCVNDFKDKLLIMRILSKILLNVTNAFMFSMMQSLKKNLLKNIMIIYCQNTFKFKRF